MQNVKIDLRRINNYRCTIRLVRVCAKLGIKTIHSLKKYNFTIGSRVGNIPITNRIIQEISQL